MPFGVLGFRITSPYGYRTDPITGQKGAFHDGIDLTKGHQAPIGAFIPGKVLYAGDGVAGTGVGGYGNVVVIQDKNNRAHVYAHLDSVAVKTGQTVKQSDVIGYQGMTGKRVTGSHLHYEVRKKSSPSLGWVDDPIARTIDPTEYYNDYYGVAKAQYTVVTAIPGYASAADAKAGKNQKTTVEAGTYFVFNESDGMINITTYPGIPGSWINPNEQSTPVTNPTPAPKPIPKEEDELLEIAIVINSFADYPIAEGLANRLSAPIYTKNTASKQEVAKEIIVVGGSQSGIKGDKFTVLSGADRYETAAKVKAYLNQS